MFVRLLSWPTGRPAPTSFLTSPNQLAAAHLYRHKKGVHAEASTCPTFSLEGVGMSSLCPSLQSLLTTAAATTTTDRSASSASSASRLIYCLCNSSGGGGCVSISTFRRLTLSPKSPQRRHCSSSQLPLHKPAHTHTRMHVRDLLSCPADDVEAGRGLLKMCV